MRELYKRFIFGLVLCLFFFAYGAMGQTTLVQWDFPNNPDDAIVDVQTGNAGKTISTVGGTSVVDYALAGASTQSASATGWDSGNGVKYWQIDFATTGYTTLKLSSAQRGPNTGPRDFKVQYKIGAGGTWTDVTGGTVIVANNFTTGILTNLALPVACENQASVFLRWIMTSNISVNAGTTALAGTSRIDDVKVTGVSGTPCTTPTAHATGLSLTPAVTSVSGSFTAAAGPPSGYLIVRNTANTTPAPVDGTSYTAGAALGTGTVVGTVTTSPFSATGLASGTQYYFFVIPFNNTACSGGPMYRTAATILSGNTTTCPATPASLTSTPSTTSASLAWGAVTGATSYTLEWKLTSAGSYTSVTGIATNSYNLTGLVAATSYDFRVTAIGAACNSSASSVSTFVTACISVSVFPWTENFESVTTPALPVCWSQNNANADTDFWQTYTTYGVGSSTTAGLYTDFNAGANNDYLILPPFVLTNNQRLKFYVRARSSGEPNDYRVVLSTTGNAPANFTTVLQALSTVSSTTMTEITPIDLSAYSGTVYIAIHVPSGGLDGYYIYFDNFTVENIPTCLPPSALTVSSILATSATVGWTAPSGTPASYNWEVRTSGSGGSGATGLVTSGTTTHPTVSASATLLTANTAYNLYVRTDCGGAGTSTWAGPTAFNTACNVPSAQATSLVLTPSGTSVSVAYTAATGSPTGYLVVRSTSNSLSSNPVNGTTYSAGNALGGGSVVYSGTALTTNNTGLSNATQYYYFVFTYNSTPCPIIYNTTSPLTGNTTTCPATPTTLTSTPLATSATLGWGAVTGAATYTLEWKLTSAGSYTTVTGIATNSYNLTGLTAATSYDFRVTAIGAVCNSSASSVSTFVTACVSITTYPSIEPFATYLPSTCWTEGDLGTLAAGPTTMSSTASDWEVDGYLNVGSNGSAKINIFSTGKNEWIISPTYDIPATGYRVTYKVGATEFGATTAPSTAWEADDYVELLVSTTGTTNWTVLKTYNSGSVPSNLGQTDQVSLNAYAGQSVRFAFRGVEGATNGSADIDFFMDDFTVELTPACLPPSALTASSILTTSATVSWTAPSGSPASYNWEVRTSGAGGSGATGLTTSGTTAHPTVSASATGLTANTSYNLYVRTDCGGLGTSTWTGPFAFTTPCVAIAAFNENFDAVTTPNLPSCWSKILRGGTLSSFATVGTSTGTNNTAPNKVALSNDVSGSSDDIILVSPSLSNLNAGTHQLRFYARTFGSGTQDLQVGTVNNTTSGATFTVFQAVDINATYAEYTVNFGAYAGSDTYIAIRRLSTVTSTSVYLDDIIWEAAPTCLPPISLATPALAATTATASWAAPASTTPATYSWEVRISGAGGSGATGLTTSGSTTAPTVTASVTGLTASTSYNLYVRTNCTGGSGSSTWAGPFAFTTACGATNVPYTQNFESATVPSMPTCNSNENAGTGNNWATVNNPGSGFTSKTLRYSYSISNAADAWYYTQGINLTAGATYKLTYRYGGSSATYREKLRVKYGTSPANASMTNTIVTNNNIAQSTPSTNSIEFVAASTGVFYLGFQVYSAANQGYLMIDDITLDLCIVSAPAAAVPTSPSTGSSICPTGVSLTWDAPSSAGCNGATGYDVYFGTAPSPVTLVSSNQVGTTYNAGTLTAGATYYWKVIPRNANGASSATPTVYSFTTTASTTNTAPLSDNFEGSCVTWNYVNSTNNQWKIGTATANGGTKSMYVTNDAGTTNAYTGTATSVTHIYTDVIIPAGIGCISVGFDWKGTGEGTSSDWDNMKVYVAPTSVTPVSNTEVSATYRAGNQWYNSSTTWGTVNIDLSASLAGTTQRFIFSWKTDGSGTYNPPVAVDNFVVRASSGNIPSGPASTPSPTSGLVLADCIAPTLQWVAPVSVNCDAPTGYDVYLGTAATPVTLVSSNQGLNNYTVDGSTLSPNTTYYWQIVPRNVTGAVTKTSCPVWSFTTNAAGIASNTPDITDDFESGCSAWTIANGSQTNIWAIGTATQRGGAKSMYITNDAGTTNAYTTSSASVVHFYRDIVFPANQCYTLSFYYKGVAESCCDYLKVYLVPTTSVPQAGTQLSSGQIGSTYNAQAAYTLATINIDNSVAGTTKRLVFSWRNDGSGGTTPPISVDDISVIASVPSVPSGAATLVSPTNGTVGLCGAPAMSWTAPSSTGCNATTGYDVYLGTAATPVTLVSSNQAGTSYTSAAVLAAGTYYWRVIPRNSAGAVATASCPIWNFNVGTGTADNETACLATTLPLNVNLGGDISCANGTGELGAPTGWTGGTRNTVWYKVVAPASGNLKIRTTLGTLSDTQIELLSATACNGTFTSLYSNNDAPACGSTSYKNSQITATGLTSGATYYIRVDGANSLVGTFNIMAAETTFPSSAGQACSVTVPVCNSVMNIGNPGYQGIGFECDFSTGGCLSSGERGSVWYKIPISDAGQLTFNIVPNDYDGIDETDYDFALWKIVGTGAVACTDISTGASSVTPLRCNYNYLGVTGLSVSGGSPVEYPGYDDAYETAVDVLAGEEYILVISNYNNSTSGFTIAFDDVAPISYPTAASVSSVTWTGSIDTDWFKSENWGGCTIPSATVDAQISPAAANQPIVTGKATCKNLVINLDSKLTLALGGDIDIHGSYTNSGTLTALATTTIAFRGAAAQSINGNLINESSLPNVSINKTGGSVTLNQDMELNGNLTISNRTLDANGKRITVAGNFTNAGTFDATTVSGSILEFDGTADQNYTNAGTLGNVIINNTGAAGTYVNIASNMNIGTTGTLTFTSGSIKTLTNEVVVRNRATTAVTNATSSYIWGYLRRYINTTGSYDFPMGIGQRHLAVVNFTAATNVDNLRGRLMAASSYSSPSVGVVAEATAGGGCNQPTYTLDGGKINSGAWEISAFDAALTQITGTGTYDISLTAVGFSNGGKYATIAKNGALAGTRSGCIDPSSGSVTVARTGLTGFSEFDIVQANDAPLPVTLTNLSAMPLAKTIGVYWATAQEHNNSHFEVLRATSKSGDMIKIGEVRGVGESTQRQNYRFEDVNVEQGVIYYYALRQVDYDGKGTYTHKVKATLGVSGTSAAKVYPNPASNKANLEVLVPTSGKVEVIVADMFGKVMQRTSHDLTVGVHTLSLDITRLASNTYHVTVMGENLYESLKLTKME